MRHDKPAHTTSWTSLLLMVVIAGIFSWYIVMIGRGIYITYDEVDKLQDSTGKLSTQTIDLGADKPLIVPSLVAITANQPWMYVTKTTPLPESYTPTMLADVSLPHGDSEGSMKLRQDIHDNLKTLFDAAREDGYDLIVSSAYRSITEQQTLYENMKRNKGEVYAKTYVLTPGASEHHTGYAVDIGDESIACKKDSDDCSLSPATAQWLENHAHSYGFIIRYPSGKDSITGIAHEPWHLRYVGVALASQLYETDTTLDEFIEQVAPGRVKR